MKVVMKSKDSKISKIVRMLMMLLTVILIALFLTIMILVSKIQGTARVVNYAGLVRGKTQQIIKLEDAKEPQDDMIASVASFIEGLRYGSDELDLAMTAQSAEESKESCGQARMNGYISKPVDPDHLKEILGNCI